MLEEGGMQRINFSTHLALVYTLIIAVPLLVFFMGASEYLRSSLYDSVYADARRAVANNVTHITSSVDSIERLESIITSDAELLRKFYYADENDMDSMIENFRSDIKNLERLQYAMPQVYALHLFVNNSLVPERWPIIFSEKRLDFSRFTRWTYNYRDDIMGNIEASKEPSVCLTREILLNKRHVGYIQISMKMTDFLPASYPEEKTDTENLVFHQGQPLSFSTINSDRILEAILEKGDLSQNGSFSMKAGKESVVVAYEKIPRVDLLVVHIISPVSITNSILLIRILSTVFLLLSIALLFVVITFATKKLVSRLYIVMNGMKKIREGHLDVSIYVPGNDEVAEMARTFSAMVERINRSVSDIKREQALVTQTEVKAMQNQINAHFLYNVLETIKMQAELHDEPEIAESITLLGRMMRYCLRWRNHRVLLKQELEYVKDYIALMNIRNDYKITLSISGEENFLDFEIPKMIIQPIVENAVLHAIEPRGEDSVIEVDVSPDVAGNVLYIRVRDYGVGMDTYALERLTGILSLENEPDPSVGGIGLRNIQERLHAFYGDSWSIRIQSTPGSGTEVIVPIPMENTL
jgi:two-component system sensor histidine kinase YesM